MDMGPHQFILWFFLDGAPEAIIGTVHGLYVVSCSAGGGVHSNGGFAVGWRLRLQLARADSENLEDVLGAVAALRWGGGCGKGWGGKPIQPKRAPKSTLAVPELQTGI